jgi:hypothetical protein
VSVNLAAFTTTTLAVAPTVAAVAPIGLMPVIATEVPPSVVPDAGDARHRRRRRRVGVQRVGHIGAGRCRRQHIGLPALPAAAPRPIRSICTYHAERGPNRMTAAPSRQIQTPAISQRPGRTPSTAHSHSSEAVKAEWAMICTAHNLAKLAAAR